MKEIAFIHASEFDDHRCSPMMGGRPEDISFILATALRQHLAKHPGCWEDTYEDLADVFRRQEPTRQTVWRWVRTVGRGLVLGLAAVGLFAIGYWLRVRAGV